MNAEVGVGVEVVVLAGHLLVRQLGHPAVNHHLLLNMCPSITNSSRKNWPPLNDLLELEPDLRDTGTDFGSIGLLFGALGSKKSVTLVLLDKEYKFILTKLQKSFQFF